METPFHEHPLLPFTRFALDLCLGCGFGGTLYGGYRCNELSCFYHVFHKDCAESVPEMNHSSHPQHPLKLLLNSEETECSLCRNWFVNGYICSTCDFKLDLRCAGGQGPPLVLQNSNAHSLTNHPLELFHSGSTVKIVCNACNIYISSPGISYKCHQCEIYFHVECAKFFPEANHISHLQHPLKQHNSEAAPDYADKECLLCGAKMYGKVHHCDVCNFSICGPCMKYPPPLVVVSLTTHKHQLQLVPRRIDFTCNACGTQGDKNPYFCLQCNFMIHSDCIDLPRVININRHDHRISYTRRLGHGNWTCGVCRKRVDGFHGAYSCSKCSNYVVHSRCATRRDVWDMLELEEVPEEEEIPPFEVIDDKTIKHFSHDHNLRINKDGQILHESIPCEGCIFQICSELFYSCEQCDFNLHQKCANLPRNKRHVCHNRPFTLRADSRHKTFKCHLCCRDFTGYRFEESNFHTILDVRCGSFSEPFEPGSHPHPLYYSNTIFRCTACGERKQAGHFSCDECEDFNLCFKCGFLPGKVTMHRYDDHPLFLSYGENNVDGEYWCEACETKVNPKDWFYSCIDCGITLHISCLVGDFSYIKPGSLVFRGEVVSNTSINRPLCIMCNTRCKLPSIVKVSMAEVVGHICSLSCSYKMATYFPYRFGMS